MLTNMTDFIKRNIWPKLAVAFLAGAGSIWAIFSAIEQNRVDRFESSMMTEYQAVASSKRELYSALDRFTFAIANGQKPDAELVAKMNDKMLDLHQRVDVFDIGLTAEDRAKIFAVKNALAEMKIEISRAKTRSDLQYVAGTMAVFEHAYQAVRPIVARKVGTPTELLSG